jgi:hypothetical protein
VLCAEGLAAIVLVTLITYVTAWRNRPLPNTDPNALTPAPATWHAQTVEPEPAPVSPPARPALPPGRMSPT